MGLGLLVYHRTPFITASSIPGRAGRGLGYGVSPRPGDVLPEFRYPDAAEDAAGCVVSGHCRYTSLGFGFPFGGLGIAGRGDFDRAGGAGGFDGGGGDAGGLEPVLPGGRRGAVVVYGVMEIVQFRYEIRQVIVFVGLGLVDGCADRFGAAEAGFPDGFFSGDAPVGAVQGQVVLGVGEHPSAHHLRDGAAAHSEGDGGDMLQGLAVGLAVGHRRYFGDLLA